MAAALAVTTTAANAAVILTFGEFVGGVPEITATTNSPAAGETTLSSVNQDITITQNLNNQPTVNPAFFNLHAVSTGPATLVGADIDQHFSGSFTITSGTGGTGTNYLSGTFTDALFGSGTGLSFSASNATPGEAVHFTSNPLFIPLSALGPPEAIALSFANVTPAAGENGAGCPGVAPCTYNSFTASISGTFSANPVVPEPTTLVLLGTGVLGLGLLGRRRR